MNAQAKSLPDKQVKQNNDQSMSARKEMLLFLLIPTGIILLVGAFLWLPSLFARPKYDFIFSACGDYNCDATFTTSNLGKISLSTPALGTGSSYYPSYDPKTPTLYFYDVKQQASRRIELGTANSYKLNTSTVSPDGYRLEQANGDSSTGFLFWGSSGDYNWYLKDGMKKKKVTLTGSSNQYYYRNNVEFIGWVEQ